MNQGIHDIRWEIVWWSKAIAVLQFYFCHAVMSHEPDGRLWTSVAWLKGQHDLISEMFPDLHNFMVSKSCQQFFSGSFFCMSQLDWTRVENLVTTVHVVATLFHCVKFVPAMTLVDSLASFEKRCNDIDDSGMMWNGLKGHDVKCFSAQLEPLSQLRQTLSTRSWQRKFLVELRH